MPEVLRDRHGHAFELRPRDCPTCGDAPQRVLGMRGGPYQRYGEGVPTRIVRCVRCGLIFPNPFPHPLDADALYGDPEQYFERHDIDLKITSYRALARELVKRSGKPTPRLLDVGAGRGDFLHAARLEGLTDVEGIEFAEAMIAHAREAFGIGLRPMTIEDYAATAPEPFDAVVLNGVLEHVVDPDSFMAAVAALCKPGALVYIDVPNEPNLMSEVGNLLAKVQRSDAVYNLQPTWPPYHVYGFNARALRALLGKHGFRLDAVRVWGGTGIAGRSTQLKDRVKTLVAGHVLRVGNWLGRGSNMFAWASKT